MSRCIAVYRRASAVAFLSVFTVHLEIHFCANISAHLRDEVQNVTGIMRTAHPYWFLLPAIASLLAGCSQARREALNHPAAAPPAVPSEYPATGHQTQNDAAAWYLKRRAAEGATEIPAERYATAVEHFARMPKVSVPRIASEPREVAGAAARTWIPLGPGNIGTRTRSLVINPQNPNIIYAGAVTGGVFKSTDGGKTWAVLTDGLPVITIGALALDPANPDTIYAGTGESWGGFPGVGIFKSTDAGATWNLPGTPGAAAFQYINRIVISRTNSLQIYAATRTGVYSTKDGGNTWQSSGINASYYGCTDLTIRTDTPTDYLFATCSGATVAQGFAVWRNTDAAGTGSWVNVFSPPNMGASVIALAPSQQSTIYLGAPTSVSGDPRDTGGLAGVFRSTSNGDPGSWTTQLAAGDPDPFNQLMFSYISNASAYCNGSAFTASTSGSWSRIMAVDPLNPNTIWLGGVDLLRSDDGGVTWGVASRWDLQTAPQYAHADRHLFVFHPNFDGVTNQTAFQVNDGGLWRTDNARAAVSTGPQAGCTNQYLNNSQVNWTHLDNSYNATQFYHGAVYPGGGAYFGGTQDNGTPRGNDARGMNAWTSLYGGDGGAALIDPADVNRLFFEATYLSQQRTTDGVTNLAASNGITESSSSFPFLAYMAMDPNDGRNVYMGGTAFLWRSTDQGATWAAAAPVESSSAVSAITVSPFDSNTVFFGTSQGYIYRSNSALTSGSSPAWLSARPRTGNVASIAFDPSNSSVMYATYSSYQISSSQAQVYRSVDAGQTWTAAAGSGSTGVGDIPVWRILVDPRTPTTLYLASDLGLLVSTNSGGSWSQDNGLPNVLIEDLGFDSTNTWMLAYTHGRGVYKALLPGASALTCSYSANPTSIQTDRFGGIFPVAVTTGVGCPWVGISSSMPGFASIQSPAQGVGNSTAYVWFLRTSIMGRSATQ